MMVAFVLALNPGPQEADTPRVVGDLQTNVVQKLVDASLAGDPIARSGLLMDAADGVVAYMKDNASRLGLDEADRMRQMYQTIMERGVSPSMRQWPSSGRGVETARAQILERAGKHQEVLSGLVDRVPKQARPSILKALDVSKRGPQEALNALDRPGQRNPFDLEGKGGTRERVSGELERRGPPAGIGGEQERRGPPQGAGSDRGSQRGGPPGGFGGDRGGPPGGGGRRGPPF
jgi:hypothetical protein